MDLVHRLNEAEVAEALAGEAAEERIAECDRCAAEFAAWAELGGKMRQELQARAHLPGYFWARQQARIRERLAPRKASARWAGAAVFALMVLAFGLIHQAATPRVETAQAVAAASPAKLGPAYADDDALLEDIQTSLAREVPEPLAPAAVLVEEMASDRTQHPKEN